MIGTALATLIRRKTKTNTTTYSVADLLVDVNLMKDEIVSRIQQVRPEVFNIEELKDSVASATSREYEIPTTMLNRMIDLEMKFTAAGDYVVVKPIARRHYKDVR